MTKAGIAIRIHQEAGIPLDEAAKLLEWILEFLKTTLSEWGIDHDRWFWEVYSPQ